MQLIRAIQDDSWFTLSLWVEAWKYIWRI